MKPPQKKPIDKITIKGYKSFRELVDFRLSNLNVLIGANGSGKSNFVSFFKLLREVIEKRLQLAVNNVGGADIHLFLGPKITEVLQARFEFGINAYEILLDPTEDNRLVFRDERIIYEGSPNTRPVNRSLGSGHSESLIKDQIPGGKNQAISEHIYTAISSWTVYHFHDTSETAGVRREGSINDNAYLRNNANNIAAYLYGLKDPFLGDEILYGKIRDAIRMTAPFFDDFLLRLKNANGDARIRLEWQQKNSDYPFQPNQLSDGTLRFICLATVLLQPEPPATILLDEPELGLHPQALDILAELIKDASKRCQVIVSTQSATLLNAFEPEDIIVVDRESGESRFRRLSREELNVWLDQEYTLGEIWHKNIIGGGPAHE